MITATMRWYRSIVDWWLAPLLCVPPEASIAVCVTLVLDGMSGMATSTSDSVNWRGIRVEQINDAPDPFGAITREPICWRTIDR